MSVSRETERLASYAALIRRWNPRINLVAPATLGALEERHIADSSQLAEAAAHKTGNWLDLGSGGGLPGLVLAIHDPDRAITLVDSDARKCVFMRTVIRELDLPNVQVINSRIEALAPQKALHVSARALAPLPKLLGYVFRHLEPGGEAWLMKGKNWQAEVDEAARSYHFEATPIHSRTEPGAAILHLTDIRHV